jgi:hypothetical protein
VGSNQEITFVHNRFNRKIIQNTAVYIYFSPILTGGRTKGTLEEANKGMKSSPSEKKSTIPCVISVAATYKGIFKILKSSSGK